MINDLIKDMQNIVEVYQAAKEQTAEIHMWRERFFSEWVKKYRRGASPQILQSFLYKSSKDINIHEPETVIRFCEQDNEG